MVVGRKGLGENDDGGEGRERTAPHFDPRAADCEAHDARGDDGRLSSLVAAHHRAKPSKIFVGRKNTKGTRAFLIFSSILSDRSGCSGTGLFDRSFRPVFYASWLQPVKTAVLTGDRQLASSAAMKSHLRAPRGKEK